MIMLSNQFKDDNSPKLSDATSYTCTDLGVVGDACVVEADCYDAVNNSLCQMPKNSPGVCQCVDGHYSSNGGTTCIARKLHNMKSIQYVPIILNRQYASNYLTAVCFHCVISRNCWRYLHKGNRLFNSIK